jgi:hypothetical protein
VSGAPFSQRFTQWLIRAACHWLPADARLERCREWTAELPAILGDESIRPSIMRALRALVFCAGIARATRQLGRSARADSRDTRNAQWRTGGLPAQPSDSAVRVVRGLAVWVVVVAGMITLIVVLGMPPDPQTWPLLLAAALAVGFEAYCLRDIARAAEVRSLSKRNWVLFCLFQIPLGGILYLSVGRVSPASPMASSHTRS